MSFRGGTPIAAVVVLLLMIAGFVAQQTITTGAFDRLEGDQVAQDAQRVRIGLESWVALLRNYGATNSIWDGSFHDIATADVASFTADFPPSDVQTIYGFDGLLGVGPDGTLRAGGLVDGETYRHPPAGMASAAELIRLFDPKAAAGEARCGVVTTSSAPYLFCGFASHKTDGGAEVAGGLVFVKSLGGAGLTALSRELTMPLTLPTADLGSGAATSGIDSSLGRLRVSTRALDEGRITLEVAVPTVGGGTLLLHTDRPRPIHQNATSVSRWLMLLMAVLGFLLFAAVLLITKGEVRRQVRPLRRTAEAVIASGDRTLRIASAEGGELGALAASIDSMLDAMAAQDASLHEASAAREAQMLQTQVQQRLAAQHLRQRAQQAVNETTQVVVAELQQVIHDAQALQQSVSSIDDRVVATDEVTRLVQGHAQTGGRRAQAVAQSLHRVGGIAELIGSVAAQTNLLALNATIEAARAGQAGRGFAVVADEVKQLAATTASSTGDIAATLSALDSDVSAMERLIEEMTEGVTGIGLQTAQLSEVADRQRAGMQTLDDALRGALQRIEAMSTVTDSIERRRHERVAVDGLVLLRTGGRSVSAALLDISQGGLRCLLEDSLRLPADTPLDLELTLDDRVIALSGSVVRGTSDDAGSRELSVRFEAGGQLHHVIDYIDALLALAG